MNTRKTIEKSRGATLAAAVLPILFLLAPTGCTYHIIPGEEETSGTVIESREVYDITVFLSGIVKTGPFYPGDSLTISWESGKAISSVDLELFRGEEFAAVVVSGYAKSSSYVWTIPETITADETYRIKVTDRSGDKTGDLYGFSGYFAIGTEPDSGLSDVTVDRTAVTITLTDNGSLVDGDTVTVSLNGTVIAGGHVLSGPPGTDIGLALESGANTLEIYAVNEGDVGPNTAQLAISNVTEGESVQQWRLYAGETGSLTISAP